MTSGHHMQRGPMTRGQILDYEFDEFIQANPHIYKKFRMLAVKLKAKGIDRWGAKSLWEVLRWDLAMETNAPIDGPALNNNYMSAAWPASLWPTSPKTSRAFFSCADSKAMVELLLFAATPVPRTTSLCPIGYWPVGGPTAPRQPTPVGVRCHGLRRSVRRASIPRWNTASRGDEHETQETHPNTLVIT